MTPRKKPTIYGPDGHPIVRARDRHAPKPRASAGLEGWVSWGLIDRKGRVVKGGEQHNLILDTFLDAIAGHNQSVTFTHNSDLSSLSHFAVGTGSTAPDVSDTSLDSELARTSASTARSTTRVADGVYELMQEREFDFAVGNGNLTEFGFSTGASANMLVRELFRDGGGNPITITKTSDYKLRIRYTLSVSITPVTLTPHSMVITGIGALNGDLMWVGRADSNSNQQRADLATFSHVARGALIRTSDTAGPGLKPGASSVVPNGSYTQQINLFTNNEIANSASYGAYVPGQHKRVLETVVLGTNRANTTISVIGVSHPSDGFGAPAAFYFLIDEGDRFTKDSLHTLTIDDLLTVSWGRA